METANNKPQQPEKHSFFSWSLKKEQLEYQLHNYHSLPLTQSVRGHAVIAIIVCLGLTIVLSILNFVPMHALVAALIVYGPLAYFIYKGTKWATIVVMVVWTLDKVVQIQDGVNIFVIVWWIALMSIFYKAYQVEKERNSKNLTPAPALATTKGCPHCGKPAASGSAFCAHCGNKIAS